MKFKDFVPGDIVIWNARVMWMVIGVEFEQNSAYVVVTMLRMCGDGSSALLPLHRIIRSTFASLRPVENYYTVIHNGQIIAENTR